MTEPTERAKRAAHTKGPWRWDVRDGRTMLVTEGRGSVFVMGFKRLGMQGAEPVFQRHNPECDGACSGCGRMESIREFGGPPDHNGYVFVSHPDADLIASAPEMFSRITELEQENARLRDAHAYIIPAEVLDD